MKAILIKNDGFRKEIQIERKVPLVSMLGMSSVNIYPLDKDRLKDIEVPIRAYEFVREFEDEYDNKVLIYREMP